MYSGVCYMLKNDKRNIFIYIKKTRNLLTKIKLDFKEEMSVALCI